MLFHRIKKRINQKNFASNLEGCVIKGLDDDSNLSLKIDMVEIVDQGCQNNGRRIGKVNKLRLDVCIRWTDIRSATSGDVLNTSDTEVLVVGGCCLDRTNVFGNAAWCELTIDVDSSTVGLASEVECAVLADTENTGSMSLGSTSRPSSVI